MDGWQQQYEAMDRHHENQQKRCQEDEAQQRQPNRRSIRIVATQPRTVHQKIFSRLYGDSTVSIKGLSGCNQSFNTATLRLPTQIVSGQQFESCMGTVCENIDDQCCWSVFVPVYYRNVVHSEIYVSVNLAERADNANDFYVYLADRFGRSNSLGRRVVQWATAILFV